MAQINRDEHGISQTAAPAGRSRGRTKIRNQKCATTNGTDDHPYLTCFSFYSCVMFVYSFLPCFQAHQYQALVSGTVSTELRERKVRCLCARPWPSHGSFDKHLWPSSLSLTVLDKNMCQWLDRTILGTCISASRPRLLATPGGNGMNLLVSTAS
jgi:hypothetical protein